MDTRHREFAKVKNWNCKGCEQYAVSANEKQKMRTHDGFCCAKCKLTFQLEELARARAAEILGTQ